MAAATDQQMQAFCDQRIRRRAEDLRAVINAMLDDHSAIDDIYARGVSNSRWDDARLDGPPHLLQSGNSANPDDALNYNSLVANLIWLLADSGSGSDVGGTLADFKAAVRSQLAVAERACVQPVNG